MTPPYPLCLTEEEIKALYDYLIKRAGYMSYEFDMPIILLTRKLGKYIDEMK